jgi:two-component system cell cycle sensor histidine kinase/response regulator CckA
MRSGEMDDADSTFATGEAPVGGPLGQILVVDDESNLLGILQETMRSHGYEVAGFSTGVDAIAALKAKEFDILLTDLMMPGMNGIELFRQAVEIDPYIVGIVMTGHATVQTAVEAMKLGVYDYLLKPFKARSLLPLLDRAIAVRRLRMENLQLRQTLAIYELGHTISYSLELSTILDKVADGALRQCEADEASVMLPAPGGEELYIAAVRGEGRESLLGQRVPIDRYVAGWVAGHQEPLILRGVVSDPRYVPLRPRPEIELAVTLPLLVGGKLMGILNLNFTRPRRTITLGELKALSIFGSIAAATLASARMHEEVKAAERKYRGIFESSTEGIFQIDPGGTRFVTANPAMARILGYDSPEELIGTVTDIGRQVFLDPDSRGRFFQRLAEEGPTMDFECECLRRDGTRIWVLMIASHATVDGEGVGFEGSIVDISSRKSAEESLVRERKLLTTIIDNIPDIIYMKDLESRFVLANAALRALVGVESLEKMRGKTDFDFFPHDLAEQFMADEKRLLETGKALINKDERSQGADGTELWTLTTKVPLKDESGTLVGIVGVGRDITDLKKVQAEVRSLARFPEENPNPVMRLSREGVLLYANAASGPILADWGCTRGEKIPDDYLAYALRAIASESREIVEIACGKRIYSLAFTPIVDAGYINIYGNDVTEQRSLEQQLLQSQKMDAIGKLAGGVAHDFNNVLTAIIGYSDFLQLHLGKDDPLQKEVEEIRKAGQRAASLTQKLLAFSRRQILQMKVLDLNTIITGMEKMLRRLINESVSIEFFLDPALGRIRADASQMEQVLLNLVINASDAMPRGGKLSIETTNVTLDESYARMHISAKAGLHVQLVVSDTGTGMDRETREHIFEPFFTTKEEGKGTGLGLSMVYGIVKQSGGNIWVYSEPGKGTAFKIYLPQVFETAQEVPDEQPDERPLGGTETILVVEDEEMIRRIMSTALAEYGYSVLLAKDGEEAWEICRGTQGPIHLLISDVVLPGTSGRESALRLVAMRPELRVLYMSGYTSNAIVHQGVLEPGLAFLQKPFAPAALLRKVRDILDSDSAPVT